MSKSALIILLRDRCLMKLMHKCMIVTVTLIMQQWFSGIIINVTYVLELSN